MKRKEIVLGAVLSIFILVSTSVLANTIQSDIQSVNNETLIIENDDPKELLFQTIEDMALDGNIRKILENTDLELNIDKEIFRILLTKLFLQNPTLLISLLFTHPIFSIDYLNYAYGIGRKLSYSFSLSEMKVLKDCIHIKNPRISDELSLIIKDDDRLNEKIEQLTDLNCGCNTYSSEAIYWDFPIICGILAILFFIGLFASIVLGIDFIITIADFLGKAFNCW